MARYLFLLGILIVVVTVYSVVDCAMIDNRRVRGLAKPVWIVVILILPVVGLVLWYLIGRGTSDRARDIAPDDDPTFTGPTGGVSESDERIRRLEAELAALDDEEIIRPRDQKPQTDAGTAGSAGGPVDGAGGSGRGSSASEAPADRDARGESSEGSKRPDARPNEDDGHTTDHGRGKGPGSTDA